MHCVFLEASDPGLATEKRLEERQEYEKWCAEKEQELAGVRAAIEKRKEEEEQVELQKLRKETVHQAQPVRHFNNVMVRPSTKPLTKPVSPRFSQRLAHRTSTMSE